MPNITIAASELQKHKLFIATPMYGGLNYGTYLRSSIDLANLCRQYGIQTQFYYLFNESLITRARAYLVDEFLRSDCTKMMFIDADIEYNPSDVLMLAYLDKDIIGGPYPKKTIAWENVLKAAKAGLADKDPKILERFVGDYVFNVVPGTQSFEIDKELEVMETGTGFMMIDRKVFEGFKKAYPEYAFRPDHNRTEHFDGSRMIHMYFDTVIDPESKRYLSEDYFFCQWCRKIGYKVWICPWMELKHTGTYIFGGSLRDIAQLTAIEQAARAAAQVPAGTPGLIPLNIPDPASPVKLEGSEATPEVPHVPAT